MERLVFPTCQLHLPALIHVVVTRVDKTSTLPTGAHGKETLYRTRRLLVPPQTMGVVLTLVPVLKVGLHLVLKVVPQRYYHLQYDLFHLSVLTNVLAARILVKVKSTAIYVIRVKLLL